jgi:hypothetical protein
MIKTSNTSGLLGHLLLMTLRDKHRRKTLQADHIRRFTQVVRLSVQHKPHGNRHPHRDWLPTPAGRLETPTPYGLDRRLIEIRMSGRLLNLHLFHASLIGDIGLDEDRAFDAPAPG